MFSTATAARMVSGLYRKITADTVVMAETNR